MHKTDDSPTTTAQEHVCSTGELGRGQKWVVVPVDPTTGMLIAGNHCQPGDYSAALVWRAMIEAAQRSAALSYTRPPLQDMLPNAQIEYQHQEQYR